MREETNHECTNKSVAVALVLVLKSVIIYTYFYDNEEPIHVPK
jgi:hypothetical protein